MAFLFKLKYFFIRNKLILFVLCIALTLRLIFFFGILYVSGEQGFYPSTNEDTREYLVLAKNIVEHGVFSRSLTPPHEPEAARTPAYPAFIALVLQITMSVPAVIFIQNLFFIGFIYFFYKFIVRFLSFAGGQKVEIGKSSGIVSARIKHIAIVVASLLSFDPSIIYWNNQLSAETLFTIILILGIMMFLDFITDRHIYKIFLSGALLAIAPLVRPIAQYFLFVMFVALIGFVVYIKYNFKQAVITLTFFIFSSVLFILPWIVRNKMAFNSYELSSVGALTFGKYYSAIKQATNEQINPGSGISVYEHVALRKREGIQAIKDHPLIFLRIHLQGLVPFFLGDGYITAFGTIFPTIEKDRLITNWSGKSHELISFLYGHKNIEGIIFWLGKMIWFSITLFGFLGFIKAIRDYNHLRPYLLLIALTIYYFALASGIGSYSRFRFPVNPLIFIFTGIGADYFIYIVYKWSRRLRGV